MPRKRGLKAFTQQVVQGLMQAIVHIDGGSMVVGTGRAFPVFADERHIQIPVGYLCFAACHVFPLEPPAGLAGEVRVGFRPSDVQLGRQGQGLRATVRRASFLGAFTDYQLDVCGQQVRTAVDTHEALARDLLLHEGDECVINLRGAHWFS